MKVSSQKSFSATLGSVNVDERRVTNGKLEEETYSLIYTSLKHPLRRRILRMLKDRPLTFSEILQAVEIDSGHLSYHLENLGDLITHSSDGKYQLSAVGVAAVKLMGGVEEHSHELPKQKPKLNGLFAKVYPLVLSCALIIAGVYFVTYTTTVTVYSEGTGFLYETASFDIAAVNVTTSVINETLFVSPDVELNSTTELTTTIATMDLGKPITVAVIWPRQERPYLFYGLAGLIIASVYPAWIMMVLARRSRRNSKP